MNFSVSASACISAANKTDTYACVKEESIFLYMPLEI